MPATSSPPLTVLHSLGLKGAASTAAIAGATGLPAAQVETLLTELGEMGLVERRSTEPSGWALTRPGRRERSAQLQAELDARGGRATVEDAYRRFLGLNPELLAVCTDWQLRPPAQGVARRANDHQDDSYDRSVVERLAGVHQRAVPVLSDLAATMPRFAPYRGRLDAALSRVEAGEGEWFTAPLRDSYHTVWFELHQDLLDTLGIERASVSEGAA